MPNHAGVLQRRFFPAKLETEGDGSIFNTLLEAIGAFLSQDNLAGPHVCCMAAFLAGLKAGVINMPWRLKSRQAERLSGILCRLLSPPFSTVLETETGRHEGGQYTTIRCGSTVLLSLDAEPSTKSCSADLPRGSLPYDGLTVLPETTQWLDLDNHLRVEVRMNQSTGLTFPTLVWTIPETRSLVRQADIRAFHERGGKLWYLRYSENGQWLACDLPGLPIPEHLSMLAASLKQAMSECLKPEKAKKTSRKRENKIMTKY